jgi:hypothetical protein
MNVACSLVTALLLFFGKVNYGVVMVVLIPSYAVGLAIFKKERRVHGAVLVVGFLLSIMAGAALWRVNLLQYLRSGVELIAGYNEAMVKPTAFTLTAFELACLFLLAMGLVALLGWRRLGWRMQCMILPLIGMAALLLFKNAFVRGDEGHVPSFHYGLPLILAVWCLAWRGHGGVVLLLLASLFYPLACVVTETKQFGRVELVQSVPLRYLRQAIKEPWKQNLSTVRNDLRTRYPECVLPDSVLTVLGRSSVDVMPWETSVAILNGLNLKSRPIPQSYSVYTPWLDTENARFIASPKAPDYVVYASAEYSAIDGRPAAWDESISKRALLENYAFESEFKLAMKSWNHEGLEPATVFLLKHAPGVRRLVPVATNEVTLALNQSLPIPATTNLVFLTLDVKRTLLGRLEGAALSPSLLSVDFQYDNGSNATHRAVVPILQTGVLVNRRVESAEEIRAWLKSSASSNPSVKSLSFRSEKPRAFQPPFKGVLVEYRVVDSPKVP